jgi:lipopolysaccharide transport system ATP-binding protein
VPNEVLRVDAVSKRFCRDLRRSLRYGVWDLVEEVAARRRPEARLRAGEFWALRDISFDLRRGEAMGLVGANGAGKTTLLRLISGLIKPDAGSLTVEGRIAPLIALGVGFNPILTGRENVAVNLAVLGLSRRRINERFEAVVDFAEVGDALDAPVQTYSSGMVARLGFACAVHTDPDILLIDEVLAVGDSRFRAKCYRRLGQLREGGTAFILVSHSSLTVRSVCESAAYLRGGQLVAKGPPDEVVERYEQDLVGAPNGGAAASPVGELVMPPRPASDLGVVSIGLRDGRGERVGNLVTGEPASIWLHVRAGRTLKNVAVHVVVRSLADDGAMVLSLESDEDLAPVDLEEGEWVIRLHLPHCGLRTGVYSMKVNIAEGQYLYLLDQVESFVIRVLEGRNTSNCLFFQPRAWEVLPQHPAAVSSPDAGTARVEAR